MAKTFYLTTAIDYTNGAPHIGHAYEKVLADVIARYHRLKGEPVYFLTGVDQHGQKVQQSAEKAGIAPQQFVDEITAKFVALWEKLEVKYDGWAATTDQVHKDCVQGILQRLYDEGQIYKDKQEGYYSIRQEQFLTDKERGADGEFGPEWGEVEHRTEENYYFKLAQHKEWLLGYLRSHPDCVTPDFRQTELINAVEKLSGDLCISRPKSRLSWGIELPFDKDYVNYVWFDALTNYISFIGYDSKQTNFQLQSSNFRDLWPALHIIGKDILIPAHGIYWPIMLHSLGFPDEQMPKILVHGWWNSSGTKMSKSLGNVVDPNELADKYGAEAVRYYLMSDIFTGRDSDFSTERLTGRLNSDLANNIGNLLNRSLSMGQRYTQGVTKAHENEQYSQAVARAIASFVRDMDAFIVGGEAQKDKEGETPEGNPEIEEVVGALGNVQSLARSGNRIIEKAKPWAVAKESPQDPNLPKFLFTWAELLRIVAILISPVLPRATHGIFDQLNWKPELSGKEERFKLADATWGRMPDGHVVGKPTPLFPRIEA